MDQYSAGAPYNQQVFLAEPPELVIQRLVGGTMGVPGYTSMAVPPYTVTFTRKFIPVWALVVAIVGFFPLLGLGLLALLYKKEEHFTIQLSPAEGGTWVTVSGVVSVQMGARLGMILSGPGGLPVGAPPMPAMPPPAAWTPPRA
jgi:hypothetical protein